MSKKTIAASALALALVVRSCLGPNHASRGLTNWNAEVSSQDWVNELLFIGMYIIPVYPIVFLGDVLIFNTMDYWGTNPIDAPEEFPESFGG